MLFNANKKNKEHLNFLNEYIAYLEDRKTSNKYDEWTFDDEIHLLNHKVAKEEYEIAIQTNRETYLKNIIYISTVVCASALGGALAYIANKK